MNLSADGKYILFDLDGTLTDSGEGIINSVKYALNKYGIHENDGEKLRKFIGPPLIDSFCGLYGFSKEQGNEAVQYYREYFKDRGIFENSLYDGAEHLLRSLKEHGRTVILATSKPEVFSNRILEHFDIAKYFDHVVGATLDGTRSNKNDIVKYAIETYSIPSGEAVMIGDRNYDIIGGKMFGLATIGVTYGYGSEEELIEAKADFIAHSTKETEDILLNI